jgi:hypothetical protein
MRMIQIEGKGYCALEIDEKVHALTVVCGEDKDTLVKYMQERGWISYHKKYETLSKSRGKDTFWMLLFRIQNDEYNIVVGKFHIYKRGRVGKALS